MDPAVWGYRQKALKNRREAHFNFPSHAIPALRLPRTGFQRAVNSADLGMPLGKTYMGLITQMLEYQLS